MGFPKPPGPMIFGSWWELELMALQNRWLVIRHDKMEKLCRPTYLCLSREWMGLGVAGMIITYYY